MEGRVWEVEQSMSKDSPKCIWHCHNVAIRTNGTEKSIRFVIADKITTDPELRSKKPADIELEFWGIAVRGNDDSIVIQEGRHDVS